jgi:RNA polymerase-binding transcription factor DksA
MHTHASLEEFARRALIERQRSLVERRAALEHDAQRLYAERESDWEDRAADVSAAAALEQLSENERVQLGRVVAALARLDGGTWGRCEICAHPIAEARLRALPEATRCSRCTNHEG